MSGRATPGARTARPAARLATRPAVRIVALAAVAIATLGGVLAAVLAPAHEAPPVLLARPVTIERALSSTTLLFGDRLEAEVDVYTDNRVIDPDSVRVDATFQPYRIAATTIDRERRHGVSLLRTRIELTCVTQNCVPPRAGERAFRFEPLTVTYTAAGRTKRIAAPWQTVDVVSRLPVDSAGQLDLVDTAPPLESAFPRSPAVLRTLLLGAALILGLTGAVLLASGLLPTLTRAAYGSRRLSPLERLLLEVEAAAQRADATERRRVLDQLATRLAEHPAPSLAARTRSLAWGEAVPAPELVAALTAQVRTSLNGRVGR